MHLTWGKYQYEREKMIGEYGEFMKDEISIYFLCITQRRNSSSLGHVTTAEGEGS